MKNFEDQNQEVQEPDLTGSYTAREYISWKTDELMELLRGKIFKMTAAPLRNHQKVLRLLTKSFEKWIQLPCELYFAPFDVFLTHAGEDWKETKNILQPDLCLICDTAKLHDRGCVGAPDLVVEILSPSTAAKDVGIKRDLYEEYGVKELWIVHPVESTVVVHVLEKGKYRILPLYAKDEEIQSPTFPDLKVDLTEVFIDE